jgi:TolB protein
MRMSRTVRLVSASVILALVVAACVAAILQFVSTKPAEAAFPGRNGDIVFTKRDGCDLASIFRIQPDGTDLTALTCDPRLPAYSQNPAWSANGKKIAFQLDADDTDDIPRDLWVMGANGNDRTNITETPDVDEWQPTWFPSGDKIAYRGNGDIEVATLGKNGKVTKTTRLASNGGQPAVSPNGKELAFVSERGGDSEIYVMRADAPEGPNNKPVKLTDNKTYGDLAPDWHPDGSKLVYASCRPKCDIFVMKEDGSGKKNLTRNSDSYAGDPAFSRDGRYIVFSRDDGLWRMRADGTRLTQITEDVDDSQPDW